MMFKHRPRLIKVHRLMLAGCLAIVAGCGGSNDASSPGAVPASVPVGVPATAPTPPGLSAIPGNAQVSLMWSASSGATSYHVKRATTSGGPYTQVAVPTSTSYTDTSLTNGTTYYYVVSALDSAGESGNSAQVGALPVAIGNTVSSIVQWVVKDPNPGKLDSHDNGS